jgi:hypothetical protein
MPFGREARATMLSKTGPGIRSGWRTPENPLGLYELLSAETADGGEPSNDPKPFNAPYQIPDLDFLERNNLVHQSQNPYGAAAGLVFGGVVAYTRKCSLDRFTDTERTNIFKTDMLMFSTYISFLLHQTIAQHVIEEYGPVPSSLLTRVLNQSFVPIIGLLTRFSAVDALRIEESLGYVTPDPKRGKPIPASLVLKNHKHTLNDKSFIAPTHAELVIPKENSPANSVRCGGHYMNFAGMSLEEQLWRRTTRICTKLPWLFPELLSGSAGV